LKSPKKQQSNNEQAQCELYRHNARDGNPEFHEKIKSSPTERAKTSFLTFLHHLNDENQSKNAKFAGK